MIVEATALAAPPAAALASATVVSTWREFQRLGPAWAHWSRADCDGVLLSHDWMAQAWKCGRELHGGEVPMIWTVADRRGDPQAGLALRCNPRTRRLCFLEEARSQRLDLVAAPGRAAEAWHWVARALRRRRDWDRLDLQFLRPEGAAQARAAFAAAGLAVGYRGQVRQRRIQLGHAWDDIAASFRPYLRANFKRRWKRLQARGTVSLTCHTSPLALGPVLRDCFALEKRGWKGASRTAIADDPTALRFYRQLAYRMAVRGCLRLFCLRVDEHLVAFEYCLTDPGSRRLYSLKIAFDENFQNASPGAVLRWLLLRETHGQYSCYEFLGHDANWKAEWTGEVVCLDHLRVFHRTLGGAYWRARALAGAWRHRLLP